MEKISTLKNKLKENLKSTVLIGNGINRAIPGAGIGWGSLLANLQRTNNALHIDLENEIKPFPLSFEEIIFSSSGSFDMNMRAAKESIALAFMPSQPNMFHERIMYSKNVEDVITTNYDYAFEKVLIPGFDNNGVRLANSTAETKHSIRRRCYLDVNPELTKSVWHIHGEINHNQKFKSGEYASQSIQIGYDHYGEFLNVIHDYLKGLKYTNQEKIEDKLARNIEGVSWIDKLFTDKIIIIGLELDFSEIDLWWLFNYRKKVFKRNPSLEMNKIVYYQSIIANEYENSIIDLRGLNDQQLDEYETKQFAKHLKERKWKAKKDVLTTLGVEFEEILCSSYTEYYEEVFNRENI